MYDKVALFGRSGSGKDVGAKLLKQHRPNWTVISSSDPFLRECERRHGFPVGTLDDPKKKANTRQLIEEVAREKLGNDPDFLIRETLQVSPPVVVVGARPWDYLHMLRENGYLMVRLHAKRKNRIQRYSMEAIQKADQDRYEQEMLTFREIDLHLYNNRSISDFEKILLTKLIPLMCP